MNDETSSVKTLRFGQRVIVPRFAWRGPALISSDPKCGKFQVTFESSGNYLTGQTEKDVAPLTPDSGDAAAVKRLLLRPTEVAEALAISRASAYKLIASGAVPHVRLGRSIRVKASDLFAFVDGLQEPDLETNEQPTAATEQRK